MPSVTSAARLRTELPPLAQITGISVEALPVRGGTEFVIHDSASGTGRTLISPDIGVCDDCLAELADPADRRYRHPFISCTNCGPRFTIITDLPYDRPLTTMADLPLCASCAAEYADPADRRFHAQTVACPDCGPTLTLHQPGVGDLTGADAMAGARRLLSAGAVVAVKGLGGYHLACDATDETAVTTLRKRKDRGDKPFAIMVADLSVAEGLAEMSEAERALLTDRRRPVVLLAKRASLSLSKAQGYEAGRSDVAPDSPDMRGHAAVHAGAPTAVRAARRSARPGGSGADQRQPGRRADRDRRPRRPDPAGGARRRVAEPRPSDPRALRRFRAPHRRS